MRATPTKEKTLYRDLIRGAFEVAWHRRELLPLGLLASLLMMNGGAFEFIIRSVYKISSGDPYGGGIDSVRSVLGAISANDPVTQMSLFFSILLFLAIFVLVALAAIAASGALLQAVSRRAAKKRESVRAAFAAGSAKIWPLILTQLIGRITIFAAFVLAALGVYAAVGSILGLVIGVILFIIFSLVALIVSFLMMMTNAGIMVSGERWVNAAHDAFRFLKRHWLVSIEMIGLVFIVAIAVGLATLAALAIIIVPFTLIILALSALHAPALVAAATFLFGLIGLAIAVIAGSFLAVFEHAAWALLYTRLAERSVVPKLERLWQKIKLHARKQRQ